MHQPIDAIEKTKQGALQPLGACRKNNGALLLLVELLEQRVDIRRPIFTVCIHDNNGAARNVFVYVDKANGYGALMAKIPPELQNIDGLQGHELTASECVRHRQRRAVIDE